MSENNGTLAVAESVEVKDQAARDGIKQVLDGIDGLKKAGLGEHPAMDALVADLTGKVVEFGQPVARGNTIYAPAGETMVVLNVDPKVITRL